MHGEGGTLEKQMLINTIMETVFPNRVERYGLFMIAPLEIP